MKQKGEILKEGRGDTKGVMGLVRSTSYMESIHTFDMKAED